MAWRFRYVLNVDWMPEGVGPMDTATAALPIGGAGAQTLQFQQNGFGPVIAGSTAGPPRQLTAGDITTMLTAMTTDLSAQINVAAKLAQINAFATGGG